MMQLNRPEMAALWLPHKTPLYDYVQANGIFTELHFAEVNEHCPEGWQEAIANEYTRGHAARTL